MGEGKRSLRIVIQPDGDIGLYIDYEGMPIQDAQGNTAYVEFCTTAGGGGRSHRTREALANLYRALILDNRKNAEGIPPYPIYLKEMMEKADVRE